MIDLNNKSATNSITNEEGDKSGASKCSLTKADEILFHTQKLLYYNSLMIEQCNRWLSEEEKSNNINKGIDTNRNTKN